MARSFNGSGDRIDVGTSVLLCPTSGGVTYAGWVNPNSPTAYDGPFGSYGVSGLGLGIFVLSSGKIAIYAGGGDIYDSTGLATLSNNTWYHLAVTFETAVRGTGYVNGTQDGTKAIANALTTQAFVIGEQDGGGAPFHGSVAEVAVWNVVLTGQEIATLAKGYSPLFIRPSSLVAHWPVIGRASPEIDAVGGFAGTVTGSAAAPHPRIIMPRKSKSFRFGSTAIAPPLRAQIWM